MKIFEQIPKEYKRQYEGERKLHNYRRLMFIGVFILLIQIFAYISQRVSPFSDNTSVMNGYYNFYIITTLLNILFIVLLTFYKKRYDIKNKTFGYLLITYLYILQLWAMGVAIADQFQGQDIVVFFLFMFVIAIVINVSVIELSLLLLSNLFLYLLLTNQYTNYISDQNQMIITSLQFILFSIILRYYIGELTKKNYLQHKRLDDLNQELLFYSFYDPLSNLYNRRRWEQIYYQMYSDALEHHQPLCVILIDIDYFKQYNDSYGHVKGDEVIRIISLLLKDVFNEIDSNIGRYGGDEFIISIEHINNAQLNFLLEQLHVKVADSNIVNRESKTSHLLTLSIGSYIATPEKKDLEWDFVVNADNNLYLHKENRKALI